MADDRDPLRNAVVVDRDALLAEDGGAYDPIESTAALVSHIIELEQTWHSTLETARQRLLETPARDLFKAFLEDSAAQVRKGGQQGEIAAQRLKAVAVRGLGMTRDCLSVDERPGRLKPKVVIDADRVGEFIDRNVEDMTFLHRSWRRHTVQDLQVIAGSDVSQHRSQVPLPARYFKSSMPFVLNYAAGALATLQGGGKYQVQQIAEPDPGAKRLRWMLIDPTYEDELDEEDYKRCLASSADVAHYRFDFEYLLNGERLPQIIFRNGSLFPTDAYLDNFVIENRRGDFVREAIRLLLTCVTTSKSLRTIYCGVSRNVQLKLFSTVADWFIARNIDSKWCAGGRSLNDGAAMTLLLSSPSFPAATDDEIVTTCLIRRLFATRANLNTRVRDFTELPEYLAKFQGGHSDLSIDHFTRLCQEGVLYMFFAAQSRTPEVYLPRYEFLHSQTFGAPRAVMERLVQAIRVAGLELDDDRLVSTPLQTHLVPTVTHVARVAATRIGKVVDTETGRMIMARFRELQRRRSSEG